MLLLQGWRVISIWECLINEDLKSSSSESRILSDIKNFIKSDEIILNIE